MCSALKWCMHPWLLCRFPFHLKRIGISFVQYNRRNIHPYPHLNLNGYPQYILDFRFDQEKGKEMTHFWIICWTQIQL